MTPWRATLTLWFFSFFKIPVLFYVRPRVVRLTDSESIIKISLNRRTRNHLRCMYFGTLSMGADAAAGLLALHAMRQLNESVSMIFKDFKADFLKRAEADVHFTCRDGEAILGQVKEVLQKGERISRKVFVTATTPSLSGDEPIARFELTLSLKGTQKRAHS